MSKFNTLAYNDLRSSQRGKALTEQSKADAINVLVVIDSGIVSNELQQSLVAVAIYDAVIACASLSFVIDGLKAVVKPRYEHLGDSAVLELLKDLQSAIENILLDGVLNKDDEFNKEIFSGANKHEILEVCMLDVVGDYDVPDDVPEWKWVEENACYNHHKNGQSGIWEFVMNLSCEFEDIPEKLKTVFSAANKANTNYIIFHQGT